MSRLFTTSPQDPRRLNQPWYERLPQTHGERRRIHGPIQPMLRDPDPWGNLIFLAATAATGAAFLLIILPGLAWLLPILAAK
jgi:hypothetical protein